MSLHNSEHDAMVLKHSYHVHNPRGVILAAFLALGDLIDCLPVVTGGRDGCTVTFRDKTAPCDAFQTFEGWHAWAYPEHYAARVAA